MGIPASQKEDAVSPVMATVFLVALTVVLIGIVGAAMLAYGLPEPTPILGMSIGNQGDIITIKHLNGEVLPAGAYKVIVDGVDKTAEFGGTVDFGPGTTLTWDSGTETVGNVSVVYIGDKGFSTLLAVKKIGIAGSGGGGGVDINIIDIGGKKFNLATTWGGEWSSIVAQAKTLTSSGAAISLTQNKIYYDNGDYWWVRSVVSLNKTVADSNPSLDAFATTHPGLIKIKRDRLLTSADTKDGVEFKEAIRPVKTGSLYTNGTILYVWNNVKEDAQNFRTEDIRSNGWVKIGILV
jgi:porphobilinogen synthase